MLPAMETVNKMKTIDRKITILTVADCRRNRLREANFSVILDLESALNLFPLANPKYCIGDIAAAGDNLVALRIGFNPKIKLKTKNATNTNGANQKLGGF